MALNGNYYGLYVNGQRVALTKSNDASLKRNFDDITTKDSSGNKESLPTSKEASGSLEGIFTGSLVNLLQWPEAFNNAIWAKGAATISGTKTDAPNGQKLAQTITWNAATNISQTIGDYPSLGGQYLVFAVDVKGSGSIQLVVNDDSGDSTSSTITLTSTWTRYYIAYLLDSGVAIRVSINKISGTAITVAYPQLEFGAVATAYRGSQETFDDLVTIQNAGTQIQLINTSNIDGDLAIQHNGFITDLALKTTNDAAVTFSCNFTSSGAIATTTI